MSSTESHQGRAVTPGRRVGRRYRSGIRPLEDRVSLSASPWSDVDPAEVTALLAGREFLADEVLVAVKASSSSATFEEILTLEGAYDAATAAAIKGATLLGSSPADAATQIYQVTLQAGVDLTGAVSALSKWSSIEWAAPHFLDAAGQPESAFDVGGRTMVALDSGGGSASTESLGTVDLDPAFGGGDGIATLPVNVGSADFGYDFAVQTDGKMIIVGNNVNPAEFSFSAGAIVRMNADGTVDTSFGTNGRIEFGAAARSIELMADGRFVVVGSAGSSGTTSGRIARYLANGALDTTFGVGGVVEFAARLNSLSIESDGKIVVVGEQAIPGQFPSANAWIIARFQVNGALDTSFNGTGYNRVDTVFSSPNVSGAFDVRRQADGKLVVVGTTGTAVNTNAIALRFNTDGTRDTAYSGVLAATSQNEDARSLRILADGKAVVVGHSNGDVAVWLVNTDGTLNTSFSGDGLSTLDFGGDDRGRAVSVTADGKFLIGGYSSNGYSNIVLARLNADGSPDATFDGDGRKSLVLGGMRDEVYAVGTSGTGFWAVGTAKYAEADVAVLRLLNDGSLDTSFSGDGLSTLNLRPTPHDVVQLLSVGGGRTLALGWSRNGDGFKSPSLWRLNADGSPDLTYGINGQVNFAAPGNPWLFAGNSFMALQSDGKVVVAVPGSGGMTNLYRFTTTGALDTTFDGDGVIELASFAQAIAMGADDKIVLLENFTGGVTLRRFTAGGAVDNTFGTGGTVTAHSANFESVDSLQVLADGKIIVNGATFLGDQARTTVFRFNQNGTVDTGFGAGGTGYAQLGSDFSAPLRVDLRSDGKLTVAMIGAGGVAFARLTAAGILDTAFGTGGILQTTGDPGIDQIFDAYGRFYTLSSASAMTVSRFTADGAYDRSFDGDGVYSLPLAGFNAVTARAISLDAAGLPILSGVDSRDEHDRAIIARLTAYTGPPLAPPTFGSVLPVTTPEGNGAVQTITVTHSDTPSSTLQFSATSTNNDVVDSTGIVVTDLGGGSYSLGVVPRADAFGTATITLTVDDGFSTAAVVFQVTVTSLNDAPTFSLSGAALTVDADGAPRTYAGWATGMSAGPANEAGQSLSFLVSTDAPGLFAVQPTIDSNGDLTFTPSALGGTAIVTVRLQDNGGTAGGGVDSFVRTFTITTVAAAPPAQVLGIYAAGTTWSAAFTTHLQNKGLTDVAGYLELSRGTGQTDTLPWANVNRLRIQFSDMPALSQGDVKIIGSTDGPGVPNISAFEFNVNTQIATITFAGNLPANKYLIYIAETVGNLDGEWTDNLDTVSGDGAAGGDFEFRFDVLPGDFDRSRSVSFGEIGQQRSMIGQSTGLVDYNYRQDYDGTGSITFGDMGQARANIGQGIGLHAEPLPPPGPESVGPDSISPDSISPDSISPEFFGLEFFAPQSDGSESIGPVITDAQFATAESATLPAAEFDSLDAVVPFFTVASPFDVTSTLFDAPADSTYSLGRAMVPPLVVPSANPTLSEAALAQAWCATESLPVATVLGQTPVAAAASIRDLPAESNWTVVFESEIGVVSADPIDAIVDSPLEAAPDGWIRLRRRPADGQVSDLAFAENVAAADAAAGVE